MKFPAALALLAVVALATFASPAAWAGTLGYWQFEEGTPDDAVTAGNTVLDSSVNLNHGAPNGTVWYSAETQTGSGSNVSAYFDGSDGNSIVVPDAPALKPTTFTLEAWMRFDENQDAIKPIFKSDNDEPHGYGFEIFGTDMKPGFFVSSAPGSVLRLSSPLALDLNTWHHLAGTYDGATGWSEFFVDGVSRSLGQLADPIAHSEMPLEIGGHSFGGTNNQFVTNGYIDQVRLSDAVLDPSEFLPGIPEPSPLATVNITADNAFNLYLSQDDDVLGTHIGGHNDWHDTQSYLVDLNPSETYYLHVIGENVEDDLGSSWAGVLADVHAPPGMIFDQTGSATLVTDTAGWRAARTPDAGTWIRPTQNASVMRDDQGLGSKNGRAPFGVRAGISLDSEWIWTETVGPENDDGTFPGYIGTDKYVTLSTELSISPAEVAVIDITADNAYRLYLSEDDDVLGTAVGEFGNWQQTQTYQIAVEQGRTYYLHVIGENAEDDGSDSWAGVLADVAVGGELFFAETGTNTLLTDTIHWRAAVTTGPDVWVTPTELAAEMYEGGEHGRAPFGLRPNIDPDAFWIWSPHDPGTDKYVTFSAAITIGFESLIWDGGAFDWHSAHWSTGQLPARNTAMIIDADTDDSVVTIADDFITGGTGPAGSVAVGENHIASLIVNDTKTLEVTGEITVGPFGTLAGGGTINADTIRIDGTVAPGGDGIDALTLGKGVMTLDGDATFDVQVSMAGAAIEADMLVVSEQSTLHLGGTLAISSLGDRSSAAFWTASAVIIDNLGGAIGDITGPEPTGQEFGTVTPTPPAPNEPALHLGQGLFLRAGTDGTGVIYYEPVPTVIKAVQLDVLVALGGDADGDGKVWLSDWAALRANFGNTGTDKTWTEGNFDPWVDDKVWLSDWAALRANFGNSSYTEGAAAAVPEPGTIAMLLAGLAGLAVAAWRRR